MTLILPTDIPIAVKCAAALASLGQISTIPGVRSSSAFVFTETVADFPGVWTRVTYRNYRVAYMKAASGGLVAPLSDWGDDIDLDHMLSRGWATVNGLGSWYIRLQPTFREINRSAGASREKKSFVGEKLYSQDAQIIFAGELEVLKGLSHPVGTADNPESIFDTDPGADGDES